MANPLKPHELAKWRAWCASPESFDHVIAPPLDFAPIRPPSHETVVQVRRGRSRRSPEPILTGAL